MAKRASDAVTVADIERYLDGYSDFAFELSVLNILVRTGLKCRHSGTYEDPVTQKTREFDIQAESQPAPADGHVIVRFATECKNLRANYPLVVHRVARTSREAFNEVVWSQEDSRTVPVALKRSYGNRIDMSDEDSLYGIGEPVGKSSDQVGKRLDGELVTGDQDVFDRISQALHSAHALLRRSHYAALHGGASVFSAVVPLLVIPPDRLWTIDYGADGRVVRSPIRAKHTTYFVERDWLIGDPATEYPVRYSLSHLEICESDYLETRVAELLNDPRLKIQNVLNIYQAEVRARRRP